MIDLHCDTLWKLMADKEASLRENSYAVDVRKLREAGTYGQFFALFMDKQEHPDCFARCQSMLERFQNEVAAIPDELRLVRNGTELRECRQAGKIGAFLTIEEGAALAGSMKNLYYFYSQGIRLLTLTWNYPNEIGWPHLYHEGQRLGLTEFGRDVVGEMGRLGMLVDVSHLSDQGFYDVAETLNGPFVASHSNCRALTNHSRNLSDPMIRRLAENGGVMGLNFSNHFLGNSATSLVTDMVHHIKHMKQVGGIDVIALGTDFDGIDCSVEIAHSGQMGKLWHALEQAGFKEREIEKIAWKNAWRVIDSVLQ